MKGISFTAWKEEGGMHSDTVETSGLNCKSQPQGEADASGFWIPNPPWEELQTCVRSHPNLSAKAMLFSVNPSGRLHYPPQLYSKMEGDGNREMPVFAQLACS